MDWIGIKFAGLGRWENNRIGYDRTRHDRKQAVSSVECLPYLTLPKVQVVCSFVSVCVCAPLYLRYMFPVLFTCSRMKKVGWCIDM